MTRNNSYVLAAVSVLLIYFLFTPSHVSALDSTSFLNRMKVKFRSTSNIFMRADSHRVTEEGHLEDTMTVTLAYQYPKRLLQWVQSGTRKEQILIKNGDSVVISYPHINVRRTRRLDEASLRRLIVKQVPFAGVFVGLASDAVSPDSIAVNTGDTVVKVWFRTDDSRSKLKWIKGKFKRANLHPMSFIIQNETSRYRVRIKRYQEDRRFPRVFERAIEELDPLKLRESDS